MQDVNKKNGEGGYIEILCTALSIFSVNLKMPPQILH